MDFHGIEVLHAADRDTVVAGVSDHLLFELLPALRTPVREDRWTVPQRRVHQSTELSLITRESISQDAQGKGRTDERRIASGLGRLSGIIHRRTE